MAVALGFAGTHVITEDGHIVSFGTNNVGQLGSNTRNEVINDAGHSSQTVHSCVLQPELVFGGADPAMIACGHEHCVCLTDDGAVWTWGGSKHSQTGRVEPNNMQLAPVRLPNQTFGSSKVLMVACGQFFTMALTVAGEVWTCGKGDLGELGNGVFENQSSMSRINPLLFDNDHITMIAAGFDHAMALGGSGKHLWTWGENSYRCGLLGRTGTTDAEFAVPGRVAEDTFQGLSVVSMAGGDCTTLAVMNDGSVWGCGHNERGQLGLGEARDIQFLQRIGGEDIFGTGGVRMVSCERNCSIILSQRGQIWVCGHDFLAPLIVPDTHDFQNVGFICIASGVEHTALVTEHGRLYTMGRGFAGALGHSRDDRFFAHVFHLPKVVPMALLQDERVGRWRQSDQDRALGFAMASHMRLGETSGLQHTPNELVRVIYDAVCFEPSPHAGPGLRMLMGFDP